MNTRETVERLSKIATECHQKGDLDEESKIDALAIEKAILCVKECGKMKVAFFGIVRNTKILPIGIAKGKTFKEIDTMAVEVMNTMLNENVFDWERMTESYKNGGGKF